MYSSVFRWVMSYDVMGYRFEVKGAYFMASHSVNITPCP